MIHANRIVTVGEQECIIDRPIVLYRGDREVEIEFTLVGNEFMFSEEGNVIKSVNASHGQLVLNTPSGEHMFSELAECHEGKVVFVVTKEMIDEFIEMGFYSFQIRLYDSAEMKSRVTIPPVMNGFDIRNPIAAEDETNVVDQGIVDYARIFKDQSNEELPTFDWTGAYNKTEWVHHDVITENKMNKIEDALYSINANIKESDVVMLNALDNVKKDADKYVKEHMAEVEADVDEFERNLDTDVQKFKVDTNAAMTAHKNEVSEELEGFSGELESINSQLEHIKYLDIRQFPKFEGENDDTERFKRALEQAENYGILKISGKLNLSEVITIPRNTKINGDSKQNTIIEFANGGFEAGGNYVEIHNCTIDGTNTSDIGIKSVLYKNGLNINECYIKNFTSWGVYVEGGIAGRLQNLDTINCGVKGDANTGTIYVWKNTVSNTQPVEWQIKNIYMHSGGGVGLWLRECTDFILEGVIVEYHDAAFKFEVSNPTCYNLYQEANRNENPVICIDAIPTFINCTRLNPVYSYNDLAYDARKALEFSRGSMKANNVEVSTISFKPISRPIQEENVTTISETSGYFIICKDNSFVRLDNAIEKNFGANSIVSVKLGNVNTQGTFILRITNLNETNAAARFAYREIFVACARYTDNYIFKVLQTQGSFLQEEPSFSIDENKNLIVTFKVSTYATNYCCVKLENLYGVHRRPVFI